MKELQKVKSHGSVARKCPDHGEYNAMLVNMLGNRPIYSICPTCANERKGELKKQELKAAEAQRILKYINSGIPKRFLKASFTNYNLAVSQKAVSNLNAVKGYAENFDQVLDLGACFTMCGKPGTGKSHLAAALTKALVDLGRPVIFTSMYRMLSRVKATYDKINRRETEETVIENLTSCDLLIVDEVGIQLSTDKDMSLFFQIVNGRYDRVLPTVLIANLERDELKNFIGERCYDRFQENKGVTLAFDWESYRK